MEKSVFYTTDYYPSAGYCIADINNDEVPELLVGCMDQTSFTGVIYDMYIYNEGKVEKVLGALKQVFIPCSRTE